MHKFVFKMKTRAISPGGIMAFFRLTQNVSTRGIFFVESCS